MNLKKLIFGNHVAFAREGAVADGNQNASAAYKPVSGAAGNWTSVGSVLDCEIKNNPQEDEILAPAPGAYEVEDIIVKARRLALDLTVQDGSEALFEMLLLNNGAITDAFVPLSASGQIKGWWQLKQYDQTDTQRSLLEVWAIGVVKAQKFDNNLVRYKLNLRVLANSLNVGTLSLG
jgi:hypothetical protein